MEASTLNSVRRFDRFTLDPMRGALLSADGKEIPLRPKSFALLRLLVENAGQLLDHATIMHAVWPDVTVTDESIVQCVRDVRKALGSSTDGLIKTVPRRGYMFSAAVQIIQNIARAEPLSGMGRPAIAILPFVNLTMGPERDNFSEGMTEDIITALSLSPELMVIARDFQPPDLGGIADAEKIIREVAARYLLRGSVRRDAGGVSVSARLADLTTGANIWARRYDRDDGRIIAIQHEIAHSISGAIEYAIAAAEQKRALREPVENLGSWGLYQRGLWHIWNGNPSGYEWARQFLQRATSLDPAFAAPYSAMALLSFNEGVVYGWRPIDDSVKLAAAWARAAVRLDPEDADALATLALTTLVTGRIDEAWEQAARALSDRPDLAWAQGVSGIIRLYGGCPGEGRSLLYDASRLAPRDPRNAILTTQIAISHYFESDYGAAAEAGKRAIVHYPEYPLAYRWRAMAFGQLGQTDLAREALGEAMALLPQTFRRYERGRPLWMRPDDYEHVLSGQQNAGWQGRSAA